MFISIILVAADGTIYNHDINIGHIVDYGYRNYRNVDEGVFIKMRTNDVFYIDEPMDIFAVRLRKAYQESAMLLLHFLEMELHQEPPPKTTRRKKTTVKKTTTKKRK